MASPNENDNFPILLPISEATSSHAHSRSFTSTNRSVSLSNPTFSIDGFDNSSVNFGYTGPLRTQRRLPPLVQMSRPLYSTRIPESHFSPTPNQPPASSSTVDVPPEDDFVLKNADLLKSGQLGMCNDPYCTTCPSYYNRQAAQFHTSRVSASRFHTALYDDARGWAKRFASSDNKCIEIDWPMTKALVSLRSLTDLTFFINILLQFRLAYVAPESRIVGAGHVTHSTGNDIMNNTSTLSQSYHSIEIFHKIQLFSVLGIPANKHACWKPVPKLLNGGSVLYNGYHWTRAFAFCTAYRRMEMMLRRRDVEQWMSHSLLPEDIRKRVREAERFNWAATRGVNEEVLFENMPEDLQREIKRHLFKFLKKVRIFSLMDESILDSIRERLKQRTYIRSSIVLHRGGLVEKMVFIVRGEMESIGEDGSILPLSEGDVCGLKS
ncbi:hypothetical protein AALP_AA3G201000 [Arabis alpina]|uniref:Cyclic nucleotide-binding domain-containing protein n=1 Tax=Arabis alpina TaxID=50452 RepID=A0A087HAE8_ARAAL|nr:hypothetical protein AALP_AA3G201000 [Arabis alpina]